MADVERVTGGGAVESRFNNYIEVPFMNASKSRWRARLPLWRYSSFWLVVAVTTFAVSTLVTVRQEPRDPYEPLRLDTLDGWLKPYDPGRAKELPAITADLRAVHVDAKDPRKVWVAGNAGTILYSADGGKTWTKQEIRAAVSEAPKAAR